MEINLPQPVPVVATVVQETTSDVVKIDFAYASFTEGKVTLKIQPWNTEITIQGAEYEAMRQQFEAGLATAFAPAITAFLANLLPPQE